MINSRDISRYFYLVLVAKKGKTTRLLKMDNDAHTNSFNPTMNCDAATKMAVK